LFENFKASSPKKGAYVFEYDDLLHHGETVQGQFKYQEYETEILYSVSNPNNASIIISEKYIYEDVTRKYATPLKNVYLIHTNIQVKDAVSGKILFNRTYKTTAPEHFTTRYTSYETLKDQYETFNDFKDLPDDAIKKEIESIVEKM